MNEQKNMILVFRWSVAVSLIASFFAVMLAFSMYSRIQFNQMNAIFCEMLRQEPEAEDLLFPTLKEYKKNQENGNNDFTDKQQDAWWGSFFLCLWFIVEITGKL